MGALWKIAARNVLRHKRRTVITGVVMSVGIGLFIMMDSVLVGMDRITLDNMIDYTESVAKVRTPEYLSNQLGTPLDYGVPDPEAAMRAIMAADGRITAVAPRARFVANVSNYEDSLPVVATAVDPELDARVFKLPEAVVSGSWLSAAEPGDVVIGSGLAEELGVEVGDYLVVSASTVYENVNADEYRVGGVVFTPMPYINDSGLFMAYGDADELLGTDGFASELVVAAARALSLDATLDDADGIAARAGAALPGLRVDSITELAKDYLAMRAMKSKFSYMIILVVLLIAAVGIVNTILMSVYARIREIGVLRAYGMSPKDIRRLFTLEGLMVGAVGSLGGVLLGALMDWYFVEVGMSIGAVIGSIDMGGLPLTGTLYGEWNPATMVVGFAFGLVVAFVAARIPAKRAARLEVTDALRFV